MSSRTSATAIWVRGRGHRRCSSAPSTGGVGASSATTSNDGRPISVRAPFNSRDRAARSFTGSLRPHQISRGDPARPTSAVGHVSESGSAPTSALMVRVGPSKPAARTSSKNRDACATIIVAPLTIQRRTQRRRCIWNSDPPTKPPVKNMTVAIRSTRLIRESKALSPLTRVVTRAAGKRRCRSRQPATEASSQAR